MVCQKWKPHIDGGFPRYILLMENQVTTDYGSEWFLCVLRYFLNVHINQGKIFYRKRCLWATTVDITIYSYSKWYAKNGSHKLTAYS